MYSRDAALAIIGIGCLFPGAGDLDAYWGRIRSGADAIGDVPPTHWRAEDYYHPDPKTPDRVYTARGGFLDPVPFNPAAFGIAPNSLEATDTAQLLGLVVAQQALADAGYGPPGGRDFDRSRASVILGVTGTLELVIPLGARLGHPIWRRALREAGVAEGVAEDVVRRIADAYVGWQENSFPGLLGNVVAGRIANRFDLGGTNCVVDAACASSLGALHLAALELTSGRSDLVLTGGVDTFNDVFMFTCFSKTPALSPTGDARPFAADADGTILGEGVGMVVLKRLADAEGDGDRIYAVIRGLGTSSDGKGNAVYAPKTEGQVEALRKAYAAAGVTPDTVELVEAHGTGTRVGDATEATSLTEVYAATGRAGSWCALGSVKSQIGHTKAAAGAAGIIKAALALHHKVLPPTIKVQEPIDALQPGRSPFYLNTEKRPWMPSDHPRRAAVSAFGFGGSNYHCVLEEAGPGKAAADWDGDVEIIALCADSSATLRGELASWPEEMAWEDLRARAARSRAAFRPESCCRLLLVVQRGKSDLARLLTSARSRLDREGQRPWRLPEGIFYGTGEPGKLAILFPGQGAQYPGMLRDLACQFPVVLDTLAEADRLFASPDGCHLRDHVYPPAAFSADGRRAQEEALRDTRVAQPALGAVSLGAWRLLEQFGVRADAAAGHSYGELTALCASGRLEAKAFHTLSALRGQLMAAPTAQADPGAMLAVLTDPATIAEVLRSEGLDLVLANKNAPRQTVLSGPTPAIERARSAFTARQVRAERLAVGAAFHSPLVAGAAMPFRRELEGVELRPGGIPVVANTNAAPYPDDPATARDLLAGQLARPVEFVAAIEHLYRESVRTFLEIGPGARLSGLVGAILEGRDHTALALDASAGARSGIFDLGCCLAGLAAQGHPVQLTAWEKSPAVLEQTAFPGKPSLTVSLCGANYVKPRPERPSIAPATHSPPVPPLPEPPPTPKGNPGVTMNGSTRAPAASPPAEVPPSAAPTATLTQALQITRDSLAALQKMQEQTAQLHRQFLEGQESAQRTVHMLVEQQQRMLQTSLGLPGSPVSAAPAPAVLPPLPPPAPVPTEAAPTVPSAPVIPAPTPPVATNPRIEQVLLEVVAEKTGYPAEMLELDMALDADLGIDSIKRVEILSALQERLPEAPAVRPEHLGTLTDLRKIAAFLANGTSQAKDPPEPAAPVPAAPPPPPTRSTVERRVLHAVPLAADGRQAVRPRPGAEVWVTSDDVALAQAVGTCLRQTGCVPRLVPCAALHDLEPPASLGGLVILAPANGTDDAFLRNALLGLRQTAPALRRAGDAFVATVSRLDGAFGLLAPDSGREPLDGGLAGLARTVRQEWPEVRARALDLADDFATPHDAAAALVEELFRDGPVDVGLARGGRRGLERVAEPMPAAVGTPLQPGDLVVLTGGARGVTAEAAVALARAFRPTLVLLGRSPEPGREPDWLVPLRGEAEIKRELGVRANGDATPRLIGEQYQMLAAQREIRDTLARIEAAGARAVYRSVDVRDAAAVAGVLALLREQFGPVRGLIHGAGVLADARIEDKTAEQFDRVYGTKVGGLRSLLAALDADGLRVVALFSSSTAHFGRAGQADYAIANEVLNKIARRLARRLPACRVVALGWGPWDGGMVTPALKKLFAREGIGLIPREEGGDFLVRELCAPRGETSEVVVLAPAPAASPTPVAELAPPKPHAVPPPQDTGPLPLAFERVLDPAGHPVLDAHVLDGRPVLPLALMLEWLAHAALHQNPGFVFHGCNDLRILHGVTLDDPPPTLRVGAGKAVRRDGFYLVPVELRGVRPGGRDIVHVQAEVVLADSLPPAPAARPLPPLEAYPHAPAAIYERFLFHGPDLQAIEQVEGCGPRGIAGLVRGAPAPSVWLNHPLRQRWITDPLAVDAALQLLVLWGRVQQQAVGLPCFTARYRQYRRAFPAGGVRVVLTVTRATGLHVLADADLLDTAGEVVARLEGQEVVFDPALEQAFRCNRASAVPLA